MSDNSSDFKAQPANSNGSKTRAETDIVDAVMVDDSPRAAVGVADVGGAGGSPSGIPTGAAEVPHKEHDTAVRPGPRRRVIALIAAGSPVPLAFARLVDAMRKNGADVHPLSVPGKKPTASDDDRPPRLRDLKAGLSNLAESLWNVATGDGDETGGRGQDQAHWLVSQLRAVEGTADAVVTTDPAVAMQVFPLVDSVWPKAVRVVVDGDYHVDREWHRVPFDDLVVPHPSLGSDIQRVRNGQARLRTGGPIVGGADVEAKRVSEDKPQVVASFASMPASDVDALLFQLSLARPERFNLLFLPSGRDGIDELVRTRAGGYGLRGKRPKAGKATEAWIRGASVLVGRPSPGEAAEAVQSGVPQLLFAMDTLHNGESFLKDHGALEHSEVPLTIAVQLESLLPEGNRLAAANEALSALRTDGTVSAASAVLEAAVAGRPNRHSGTAGSAGALVGGPPASPHDDELEDIGAEPPPSTAPTDMTKDLRRAYLSEIILHQKKLKKQIFRAKEGHISWTHRAKLAANAGDDDLARKAIIRVEGLERIGARLNNQMAELNGLRDRFAGRDELTEADRHAASKFMSPEVASTLDRSSTFDPAAFTRLELNDALQNLKDKLKRD